jgi:hypothetical protein
MLLYSVIIVAVVIAAILAFAATRPDTFRIERSIRVNVLPEKIFPLINDFHHWAAWSPWEKLDPAMKKTYTGAANGKGAVYEWEGNGKVGAGRMEITESHEPAKVIIQLSFLKPFKAQNLAEFSIDAKGDSTDVIWAMSGSKQFMLKVMGLFMNMDKMVGKDFETGLSNMKAVAEA